MKTQVITYQTTRGNRINLTRKQCSWLTRAGKWPKNWAGEEYATVSHGLHYGDQTYTDSELASEVGIEEAALK